VVNIHEAVKESEGCHMILAKELQIIRPCWSRISGSCPAY